MAVSSATFLLQMSLDVMGIRDVPSGLLNKTSAMFISTRHSEATHVAPEALQLVLVHEFDHLGHPPARSAVWVLMQEEPSCADLKLVHLNGKD